jgi:flagellar L-ring protein precursor FlgH
MHIATIGAALTLCAATWAESLWTDAAAPVTTPAPLVSTTTARQVGDLLTVLIFQESIATMSAQHASKSDSKATMGAGSGLLQGFQGFGASGGSSTSGAGTSTASTRIVDRLTVRIAEVMPDGNLRIEGMRAITLDKDKTELAFRGLVRPSDVAPDNTISSMLVANQELVAKGSGPVASKRKPGLLGQIFGFLF